LYKIKQIIPNESLSGFIRPGSCLRSFWKPINERKFNCFQLNFDEEPFFHKIYRKIILLLNERQKLNKFSIKEFIDNMC